MATTVFETVEVDINGETVALVPLKIKFLREFMTEFQKISDEDVASDNIQSMDLLTKCAAIAMKQYKPEWADVEVLEDIIDLPTIYKVIEVASGIKLNDPNALAAALAGAN